MEADKDLVDRLADFMPRVVQGERPGMVFNVSYGLQGQARYTHVPSILEMVGIPYVASGPLGHSLALDKVVTKMVLRQRDIPTPGFTVLDTPETDIPPDLSYPMVVKPKNEAVSFGLEVVNDEESLRRAAGVIFKEFRQPVLVEQYIEGCEINVGLLGNDPVEAFPPVMLEFGEGAQIYTFEDKVGLSGREIQPICPAPIGDELTDKAKEIAIRTFNALGLYDCARIDMRLDKEGRLFVLEANSLPSLGEHGSYLVGADYSGLNFADLVNRLVDIASARYFGTPDPSTLEAERKHPKSQIFSYITQRRQQLEKHLRDWVQVSSHTDDPLGIDQAVGKAARIFEEVALKPVGELTDRPEVWTWQSAAGLEGGTLLIGHLDTPIDTNIAAYPYRTDPEWVYGEGVGTSRAPLVMMEFALRALRNIRKLRRIPLGVLLYTDEGRHALHSSQMIRAAAAKAKRVIVLDPAATGGALITSRRGSRRYRLSVEGESLRPGLVSNRSSVLRWTWNKLEQMAGLGSSKKRLSVEAVDLKVDRHPMMVPHRVTVRILVTYFDSSDATRTEDRIREILGKRGPRWTLSMLSDRPPMKERAGSLRLAKAFEGIAEEFQVPIGRATSTWPSVAGLVPSRTACISGAGPVSRDRGTPKEAVQRMSLVQRTILMAGFLASQIPDTK